MVVPRSHIKTSDCSWAHSIIRPQQPRLLPISAAHVRLGQSTSPSLTIDSGPQLNERSPSQQSKPPHASLQSSRSHHRLCFRRTQHGEYLLRPGNRSTQKLLGDPKDLSKDPRRGLESVLRRYVFHLPYPIPESQSFPNESAARGAHETRQRDWNVRWTRCTGRSFVKCRGRIGEVGAGSS